MDLTLHLRTRFEVFKGSDEWEETTLPRTFPAHATALLLCDMWDDHWCKSAARRCAALAHKMNPIIATARDRGVQIIHAPSECMAFYQDTPQRQRMVSLPVVDPVPAWDIDAPPLPIDDSDGGCDDSPPCPTFHAWTRQHPAIAIAEPDAISDSGLKSTACCASATSKRCSSPACIPTSACSGARSGSGRCAAGACSVSWCAI